MFSTTQYRRTLVVRVVSLTCADERTFLLLLSMTIHGRTELVDAPISYRRRNSYKMAEERCRKATDVESMENFEKHNAARN